MAKKEPVFNPKHRKVLRKKIPVTEISAGIIVLVALLMTMIWILSQKNAFDPAERDLAPRSPNQGSKEITLYKSPPKRWTEQVAPVVSTKPDLGIFPESILSGNWKIARRLKKFNKNNLFEIINGEAEKFLKQGFKELYYIVLEDADSSEQIDMELYDQGSFRGSTGVFSEYLSADTKIERSDETAFLMTSAGAIGRKGRFFFRIMGSAESENIRKKSARLVDALKALPKEKSETPAGFQILNKILGIDSRYITFQGKDVFQFDFAKDFWFGSPDPSGSMRVFLHLAQSPTASRDLFERLATELSYDFDIKEQNKTYALLRHPFLKNWFALGHNGSRLFGVENGPDRAAVMKELKRLQASIISEK